MPMMPRVLLLIVFGIYNLFQMLWVLSGAQLTNVSPEDLRNPAYLMGVVIGCAFGLCLGCLVFIAQIRYMAHPDGKPCALSLPRILAAMVLGVATLSLVALVFTTANAPNDGGVSVLWRLGAIGSAVAFGVVASGYREPKTRVFVVDDGDWDEDEPVVRRRKRPGLRGDDHEETGSRGEPDVENPERPWLRSRRKL
ncbi:MAG TPA: hypothetical protein VMZ71_16145 [Gemmataceae bacterium]|nr:hypothetical protein [Gemmataceae bacterium]